MSKFSKFTYYGNPFIGMFARANNEVTLIGVSAPDKFSRMADLLETKLIRISFADSSLIGLYCVMNDHGIVLSNLIDDSDVERLKAELKNLDIDMNVTRLNSNFTAVGNSIVVNNHGAVVNPNIEEGVARELSDALDVDVAASYVAGFPTAGSAMAATNNGFIAHPNVKEDEIEIISSVLKTQGGVGTINGGVPFVGIGLVANDRRALVGELTTGFEMHRVEETLGLIR